MTPFYDPASRTFRPCTWQAALWIGFGAAFVAAVPVLMALGR